MLFQSLGLSYLAGLGPDHDMPWPVIRYIFCMCKGILDRSSQYKIVEAVL